jgi:hypothetical protein
MTARTARMSAPREPSPAVKACLDQLARTIVARELARRREIQGT